MQAQAQAVVVEFDDVERGIAVQADRGRADAQLGARPGAVEIVWFEVTGQLTSAVLAASPGVLMLTWPWVRETRPTRPGASSASTRVEKAANASSVAVVDKRRFIMGSRRVGRNAST
ncbi:hypothetical protein [Massilia sp. Se16.2.3]|uniref:hypothetical protein n=1 Tax=Massilia sp. Se16.2.3 TaxID=2709303 RepID=UPI00160288A4|nr:hypothetical protein [Massilia sp. Se16.2.3]QNA98210.1 hypothetical protein G4G31_04130 [Massilia sp. Se16.2.3]